MVSRIGEWWLRNEVKWADACEKFNAAVFPPLSPLPPVAPTERASLEVIATQLTRIADALESSQLGSEATAPAGDPPQPPSPSKAAAGETGVRRRDLNLTPRCRHPHPRYADITCVLDPGHEEQHWFRI